MNTTEPLETSVASAPAPVTPSAPDRTRQGASGGGRWLVSLLALLFAVAAGVISFFLWQRQHTVEAELARKLTQSETRLQEISVLFKASQDAMRELQARQALTESKVADSVSQQAQLEKLYRELARNRDDWELADAEQAIQMAAQQLQSAGNTRAALAALQDADARLSRVNLPAQLGVRRLIARDVERLQTAQATDTTSLVNQIDGWITQVDRLPMLAPDRAADESGARGGKPGKAESLLKRMVQMPQDGWDSLRDELSTLFKVRRIDNSEAMFVAPEQAFFARENLKLKLASARLAVMTRNDALMRAEVGRSLEFVQKYFDGKDKQVDSVRAGLAKLRSTPSFDPPSLAESLAAMRSLRQKDR